MLYFCVLFILFALGHKATNSPMVKPHRCPLWSKSELMHCNMISAKRMTAGLAVFPKSIRRFDQAAALTNADGPI